MANETYGGRDAYDPYGTDPYGTRAQTPPPPPAAPPHPPVGPAGPAGPTTYGEGWSVEARTVETPLPPRGPAPASAPPSAQTVETPLPAHRPHPAVAGPTVPEPYAGSGFGPGNYRPAPGGGTPSDVTVESPLAALAQGGTPVHGTPAWGGGGQGGGYGGQGGYGGHDPYGGGPGAPGGYGGGGGGGGYGYDDEPPYDDRPRRRRGPVVLLAAVLFGAAGLGGAWAAKVGPFAETGAAAGGSRTAAATAKEFLAAWAAGDWAEAANLTDEPTSAETVLQGFTEGLKIAKPVLTPGSPRTTGAEVVSVPFKAAMPVAGKGTWTYESTLPLSKQTGGWKVDWDMSLVHPQLSDRAKFRLADAPPVTGVPVDRTGELLSSQAYPSLAATLNQIDRRAEQGASSDGVVVQLIDRQSGQVLGTEARLGTKGDSSGNIATTIDPQLQKAVDRAFATRTGGRDAALVAVSIDKGEILAVGNTGGGAFDRAFSGTYAPGSTWKVLSSAALLAKGAVTPESVVDCPQFITVGKQFRNTEGEEFPNATFTDDFVHSCNTAFVGLRGKLGTGELGDFAAAYFGVGKVWKTGVSSFDGKVPLPASETEKAASLFGQGRVLANPLIMASVTATAVSGSFHQPVLHPDQPRAATAKPLPPQVALQLRGMMRETVVRGTARLLADLGTGVGAKTGTAETTEGQPENGWLVAYRGNVAVACIVERGGHGSTSAGPIVHDVLAAVQG